MEYLTGFAIGLAIAGLVQLFYFFQVRDIEEELEMHHLINVSLLDEIAELTKEIDEAGLSLAKGKKRTYLRKKCNKK